MNEGYIKASCGHELTGAEGLGVSMSFAEYDKDGKRCVVSGQYCSKCASKRRHWWSFIDDEKQGKEWLRFGVRPGRLRAQRHQ